MAKSTFNAKGIGTLLKTASQLEQAIKEDKQEEIRELTNHILMLPIEHIEANRDQPRKNFDNIALTELAESIMIHGLIQPITVRRLHEKAYQIISGERRYRASKMAGLKEVPAYIRVANSQEVLEMALVENIQREDLNALEIADTYTALQIECNMTLEQIAERVGKERSTVNNYIRLRQLHDDVQTAVRDRQISMGHARALAGLIDDPSLQLNILKQIISKSLSVRAVEEIIQKHKEENKIGKGASSKTMPNHLKKIQDDFGSFFGSKVALKRNDNGAGQLVVKFDNDTELNRLIDLIEESKEKLNLAK
ncbi:MAG: ParB/RepB/Spo0J family partition protein [Bacteroidota bacterium]